MREGEASGEGGAWVGALEEGEDANIDEEHK